MSIYWGEILSGIIYFDIDGIDLGFIFNYFKEICSGFISKIYICPTVYIFFDKNYGFIT